jgi:hypothetical protein
MWDHQTSTIRSRATREIRLKELYKKIKSLQGDPHYVAMGASIGVFVGITPTIPLHTVIALGLAFALKSSKPAAAIAVWVSNPVTIPLFYYTSFKFGALILGHELTLNPQLASVSQLLQMGWDVTLATIVGGALLGIVPAVATYFLTYSLFQKLRLRHARRIHNQSHAPASGHGEAVPKKDSPARRPLAGETTPS